jgi:hypothetical protein
MARIQYEGMDDAAVLGRASAALKKAAELASAGVPRKDPRRVIQMWLFDQAQDELTRRFIAHVKAQMGDVE